MSIFKRAKTIYKKSGGTWQGAIKKAAAELRAGKRKPAAKKKAAPKKKAAKKRRRVGSVTESVQNAFTAAALGGTGRAVGSVAHHIGKAKTLIADKIAVAELRKFQAKKKTAKRKISKTIAAYKVQYRKLS